MKEKCDNKCETCPMQTQVHCTLLFCKATNASVSLFAERLEVLETKMGEESKLLIPQYSVKHPTLEEDETKNNEDV